MMARGLHIVTTAALLLLDDFSFVIAVQKQVKPNGDSEPSQEIVCVSAAVYEPVPYVNMFVRNFLKFAEPSTRLVMHLDAATDYLEHDIERWQDTAGGRVTSPLKRIPVKPFMGSILFAQMLNAEWADQHWNNECTYFVYQASNMMWVRKGFEAEVRSRRYGQMRANSEGGCDSGQSITKKLIPNNMYGWGQPEGSFYPMSMVRNFYKVMINFFAVDGLPEEHWFQEIRCYMEAFSMQTYAINFEDEVQRNMTFYKDSKSLSWNHVTYGDKDHDSCPKDEIIAIHEGKRGWEPYYAVKRVNRDVNHPITQYIDSLKP